MKNEYENWSKEDLISELKKVKSRKKYGLVWENKQENIVDLCKKNIPILEEIASKEVITDKTKPINLFIEGDNYPILSILNYTHRSKVDIIYIDPPYNTGNSDFIYNDKFIDKEDTYRHSKWLSFMDRRLRLAKNLLKDTGIIFISIDDNELAQLKLLCDDIFGESNLLELFHIQVRYASKSLNEKGDFQKLTEQVLIYAKNKSKFKPNKPTVAYDTSKFKYEIQLLSNGETVKLGSKMVEIYKPNEYKIIEHKDSKIGLLKETWASGSVLKGNTSGKFFKDYIEPRKRIDGLEVLYKVYGIGEDGIGYRFFTGPKKETSTKGKFYSGVPLFRVEELKNGESLKENPIVNLYDYSADFGNIRLEGGIGFRSGKKPVKMLKELIKLHPNNNALVLDFFAGSGSTGHAVIELNSEDLGRRTFILATSNEGEEKIAENICHPRLINVIKGYANNAGVGGNLKYFKTSFIKSSKTDYNKALLTRKAIKMLCVKESAYNIFVEHAHYQIFESSEKYLAVLQDIDHIDAFKTALLKLDKKIFVYIFSLGNDLYEEEFKEFGDKVTVSPIPEAIYKVYKRIFQ